MAIPHDRTRAVCKKIFIRIRRGTAYIKVIRKMNTTWETHKFEHYIFSLLLAVEVIMSFTFLGYVHIPPISITTAYIPIVITACLFGPAEASLSGLLFGLGSLYKASATYVMPADAVFSPFRSDFPIGSILLSVGTPTFS